MTAIKKAWRKCFASLVAIIAAMLIFCFSFLLGPGNSMYYLGSLVGTDTTVFSSGYSERIFLQIRPGMHKSDVLNLLGLPLAVSTKARDRTCWNLSFGGKAWIPRDQFDSSAHKIDSDCSEAGDSDQQFTRVLHYTMSLTDKDYLVRTVGLSDSNIVLFVGSSYWTD